MAKVDDEKKPAISYFAKDPIVCPCCNKKFQQEVMHQGGGRTIAGNLTDELHRLYEPSKRFGKVYPVLYDIGCCPYCNCALFYRDFKDLKDPDCYSAIAAKQQDRLNKVNTIFPHFKLDDIRTLYDGAAIYYMALLCYEEISHQYAPTFKKGMISLRLAWLCRDLETECPGHNFELVAEIFYRKALFFYQQTLLYEMEKVEPIGAVNNLGPDTDKNYGYDGVVYMCGLLEYKYGQKENMELRLKKLDEAKRSIARIFGFGKSSKNKPGPLLETARNLYDQIAQELSSNNLFDDYEEDEEDDFEEEL